MIMSPLRAPAASPMASTGASPRAGKDPARPRPRDEQRLRLWLILAPIAAASLLLCAALAELALPT
jgi:hypothetical protein